jgi:hypothetical protein
MLISDLIANLEQTIAKLKKLPKNVVVMHYTDEGGYTAEAGEVNNLEMHVSELIPAAESGYHSNMVEVSTVITCID